MNENYKEFTFNIGNTGFNFYFDSEIINRDRNYKSGLHLHNFCEIIYVVKGEIAISSEDSGNTFHAGQTALIPANIFHSIKTLKDQYKIAMEFSIKKLLNGQDNTYPEFEKIIKHNNIVKIDNELCRNAFERILKYYSISYDYSDELIKACLCEMMIIIKNTLFPKSSSALPILSQTDGYRNFVIDTYLSRCYVSSENITLDTISKTLHLSPRQIEKIFKKTYGQTFREKTCELKMIHALDLICNTNLTVLQIANDVGYTSVNGFIKAFEKKYNSTPAAYRKICTNR